MGNIDVDVLISNKFTHKQNLEYIDKIFNKIKELNINQTTSVQNKDYYVIEYEKKLKFIKTMTMVEYAKEQQKNKRRIRKNNVNSYSTKI